MGEKDIAKKTLEAYNDVFADIVNVLLFNGKPLVKEEDLSDLTPVSQYKIDKKLHGQERDVAKFWHSGNVCIAIYGLENQTDTDPDMPLRIISYDGVAYRDQLNHENKDANGHILRFPVVTMVLYFGEKPWKKPRRLLDRIIVPEALQPYVSDYRINVFEICRLSDEQLNLFTSDFKIVADYFVQMYRNKDYKPSKDTIKHVQEVLSLLSVLTKNDSLEKELNAIQFSGKEGPVNMEAAWQKAMDQNYNDGYSACKSHMEATWQKEMDQNYHDGYLAGQAKTEAAWQKEMNLKLNEARNETISEMLRKGFITKEQAAQLGH